MVPEDLAGEYRLVKSLDDANAVGSLNPLPLGGSTF